MTYEEIRALWERTKPFKGREDSNDRPWERRITKWVRNPKWVSHHETPDESFGSYIPNGVVRSGRQVIRLEPTTGGMSLVYWGSPAATFHPDGKITLFNTSIGGDSMAEKFLPKGISLSSSSGLLFLGQDGKELRYWGADDGNTRVTKLPWSQIGATVRKHKGRWVLDDPASAAKFTVKTLDRAKARALSAEYNLASFINWFNAYTKLNEEAQDTLERGGDYAAAAQALREGDYLTAANNLSAVEPQVFGNTPWWSSDSPQVTLTSIRHLRMWIYNAFGAISTKEEAEIPLSTWATKITRDPYHFS